ncbi:hypothetical protein CsatB_023565 [Cannabis sativa]
MVSEASSSNDTFNPMLKQNNSIDDIILREVYTPKVHSRLPEDALKYLNGLEVKYFDNDLELLRKSSELREVKEEMDTLRKKIIELERRAMDTEVKCCKINEEWLLKEKAWDMELAALDVKFITLKREAVSQYTKRLEMRLDEVCSKGKKKRT